MSGRFYKPAVRLTVARVQKDQFFVTRDELVIEDLRVGVEAEKNLGSEPNTCKLTIYNLAEESRALLKARPLAVTVEAGYDGDLAVLFRGDVRDAQSELDGVTWKTEVLLGDGARAHRHSRVSKSYAPGIDAKQILKDLAGAYGVKIPTSVDDAKELLAQFAGGYVAHGPTEKELTKILAPHGMSWSVQDGKLQVVRGDEALEGTVLDISVDSGMLGSPVYGAPTKKGGKHPLTVRTFLRPDIAPGRRAQLTSREESGSYKVESVKHVVDPFSGQACTSTATLRAV